MGTIRTIPYHNKYENQRCDLLLRDRQREFYIGDKVRGPNPDQIGEVVGFSLGCCGFYKVRDGSRERGHWGSFLSLLERPLVRTRWVMRVTTRRGSWAAHLRYVDLGWMLPDGGPPEPDQKKALRRLVDYVRKQHLIFGRPRGI